jgi:Leucine-rich repeat (LRR) protein
LTALELYGNQLTFVDVSANTALTSLDVGYNQLSSIDVSANTALIRLFLDFAGNIPCADVAAIPAQLPELQIFFHNCTF